MQPSCFWRRMLFVCFLGVAPLLACVPQALAQVKTKLRPLRIALPSNTIAATHFYVGRSLGIFESHGFDPQILVLEPRAALAALLTGDLDFYTATGTTTRAALRGVPVRVIMVGSTGLIMFWLHPRRLPASNNCGARYSAATRRQATVNTILIELLRKRGLKPDEYKILNVGTARLPALLSGNVPAAVLNGLETAKAVKQGFRPLARAADEIELATGGLGASVASIQSKREDFRAVVQAVLESIRISATQKERVLPVLMKQFSIPYDDASLILDIVQKGWALDGRPTPGSQKFEFDLAQREMGLKEPPKPEQVYDFSILEEVTKK